VGYFNNASKMTCEGEQLQEENHHEGEDANHQVV